MHWIWLVVVVLLTLILVLMIPPNVARTAIGNCTRTDGTKSQRRKRREIRHLLEFLLGVLSIPVLIIGIHAGVFILVDKSYVDSVPSEWVDEIERADTEEGEVGEALTQLTDWQDQQRKIFHTASASWYDVLRNLWLFFVADAVLMGLLLYWFIGPFYVGLVSNYREGIERRHRHYTRIDRERAEDSNNEHELSASTDIDHSDSVQLSANAPPNDANKEAENLYMHMDDFFREISQTGFLEALFKGLELPNKPISETVKEHREKQPKSAPAEYKHEFPPDSNTILRDVLRDQIAQRAPYIKRLREAENELNALRLPQQDSVGNLENDQASKVRDIENRINELMQKISKISTFDTDNPDNREQSDPINQAVLFCLMDASGSMGKISKDIAKRFFILFYLFLKRSYEHVKVVYIRHHTSARELDEDGFFQSRETGGTVISSALKLMYEIMQERFQGPAWEIYAAQVSDGDNWDGDSPRCCDLLNNKILPSLQYYVYVETTQNSEQNLWQAYQAVETDHHNFATQQIDHPASLYPMFRDLFDKRIT